MTPQLAVRAHRLHDDVYMHGTSLTVYRDLAMTAHAAIRAANPKAIVLGPDVSWHGIVDGWFAASIPMRSLADVDGAPHRFD
jgi:hypothetical protein